MIEFLVDNIINKTEIIAGKRFSYKDAVNIIKNKYNNDTAEKIIDQIDMILISKGYAKLIDK